MKAAGPTIKTYNALTTAYDFFNKRLFAGELPSCLITMQRKAKSYGYFAGDRFGSEDGSEITDEIALNPSHFKDRTLEETLSTLAHEMVHLWQHHKGKPSRGCYHNKEWAGKMHAIGLIPSSTGAPGGKETGQQVTHYIEDTGKFQRVFQDLTAKNFASLYVELWSDDDAKKKTRKKKPRQTANHPPISRPA